MNASEVVWLPDPPGNPHHLAAVLAVLWLAVFCPLLGST